MARSIALHQAAAARCTETGTQFFSVATAVGSDTHTIPGTARSDFQFENEWLNSKGSYTRFAVLRTSEGRSWQGLPASWTPQVGLAWKELFAGAFSIPLSDFAAV